MYGAYLRRIRTSRGLSQRTLAEIAGISQPNLSAYENDRRTPTLDVFNRLLVACGYLLVADGGTDKRITFPLPKAGWFPDEDLPPRLPDDPPDEPSTIAWDAGPEERARAVSAALALADVGR
jgi:transcriptional regulator with XRE-family HTH domain